jgi:hypothetical protein
MIRVDGIFRLTKTIENPKPDKRYSNDWRFLPSWPAGTRFVVQTVIPYDDTERQYREMYCMTQSDYRTINETFNGYKFNVILANAEKEPESLDFVLKNFGLAGQHGEHALLNKLVDGFFITLEDVKVAAAELKEDWNKEE